MTNPLVSVVIPTRNRPVLLKRAIESVLAQTYADLEIIVVIDGPDPATEASLRTWSDARLKVSALSTSVGGAEARNVGVRAADGEWIAFLDDDDEWLPYKLERQVALASEVGDENSIIACKVIGRFPGRDYIWPRRYPRPAEPLCEYLFNRSSWFRGEGQLQTSMLLVPRSMMQRLPFTAGLKKHQDTDWYIRAAALPATSIHFVDAPLAVWYLGEDRETVFRTYDWERSWRWLLAIRPMLTRKAFAGFIATQLISEATAQGQIARAFPFLSWQMLVKGRPRAMDWLLFLGNSLFSPGVRSQLRRILSRKGGP